MSNLPETSRKVVLEVIAYMREYAQKKIEERNKRYADAGDGLANLRSCEQFGISPEQGIIVRMADKLKRIQIDVDSDIIPPSELGLSEYGVDNNDIPDLINYALLLYAVRVIRRSPPSLFDNVPG